MCARAARCAAAAAEDGAGACGGGSVAIALEHRKDRVARPLADLLVDAPNIFADQPESEQHHAEQEKGQDVAIPESGEALAPARAHEAVDDDDEVGGERTRGD